MLLGIVLAGLVWTGSRAGLLAGMTVLLVAGIGRLANRRMLGWGAVFAATLWAGVWLGGLGAGVQNVPVQSALSGEFSDRERWATLIHALELWQESPILGAGLGVFIAKSPAWLGYPQVIHNTPLWLLAEFGLVGVMIVGWAFFLLVRHAIRFDTLQPARRVLLFLIMVFAIFSFAHEIFFQRIFWFVLGAMLARPFVFKARL